MTNPHLLNLLSFLFVPFPPQRCDTISPWPHLLSVTSRQVGTKLRTDEQIAEGVSDSARNIQRFIRLTNLIPEILEMVDQNRIAFNPAVELSFLKPQEQEWVERALDETQQTPSLSQAQRIKQESKEGTLTEDTVHKIISEEKKPLYNSVTLSHDTLKKYFPKSYTAKQMENVIIRLLDSWLKKRQQAQER
jgi:ParB family chromosome partitioning protein